MTISGRKSEIVSGFNGRDDIIIRASIEAVWTGDRQAPLLLTRGK